MNRWMAAAALCTALFFLTAGQASAHKVNIYAYEEGGKIHTESYFVDGTPARDSRVTAYDKNGKVVAEGRTNDDGVFVFSVEHPGDLRIVLEASMGHRNEILLPAADTVSGGAEPMPEQGKNALVANDSGAPGAASAPQGPSLDKAIDRVLARRLGPIQESIINIQRAMERPSLSQILGGLGYIIGIAGAFLWGMSRKKDI